MDFLCWVETVTLSRPTFPKFNLNRSGNMKYEQSNGKKLQLTRGSLKK